MNNVQSDIYGMGPFSKMLGGASSASAGDQIALFDLDRKARDAVAAHLGARRALARAVAASRQETARRADLAARSADLEERAVFAVRAGRDDMAAAAAETIASLDCEFDAATRAVAEHDGAVVRLRRAVEDQRRRLADIDRGRRLAVVRAALGESRDALSPVGRRLSAAEQALDLLLQRQNAAEAFEQTSDLDGSLLVEDMAEAGFGAPLRPMARDVLERIRARATEIGCANAVPAIAKTNDTGRPTDVR